MFLIVSFFSASLSVSIQLLSSKLSIPTQSLDLNLGCCERKIKAANLWSMAGKGDEWGKGHVGGMKRKQVTLFNPHVNWTAR